MRSSAARLIVFGAAGSMRRLAGIAAGVALGTGMLLILLGAYLHMPERDDRGGWSASTGESREFSTAGDLIAVPPTDNQVLLVKRTEYLRGRAFEKVVAATTPTTDVAFPAGLPRLAAGEYYASPALAELVAKYPHDELADRLGTMKGELPRGALKGPDQVIALVGEDWAQALGRSERSRAARVLRQGSARELVALSHHPWRGLRGVAGAHRASHRHRVSIGCGGAPRTLCDGAAHWRGTQGHGYALGARNGRGVPDRRRRRCGRRRRAASCSGAHAAQRHAVVRGGSRAVPLVGRRLDPGHDRPGSRRGLVARVPRRARRVRSDARARREARDVAARHRVGRGARRLHRLGDSRVQEHWWRCAHHPGARGRLRSGRIRHRARRVVAHQGGEPGLRSVRTAGAVARGRGAAVPSPPRDL